MPDTTAEEIIPLQNGKPLKVGSVLGCLVLLVAPWIARGYLPQFQSADAVAPLVGISIYAAVLLVMELHRARHAGDTLRFDDDGLSLIRGGRSETVAWREVETFWLDWTWSERALRIRVGDRLQRLDLSPTIGRPDVARRLRELLEPPWRDKLQAMNLAEVVPPITPIMRLVLFGLPALAVGMGVLAVTVTQPEDQVESVGGVLICLMMPIIFWATSVVRAGPDFVQVGPRRIALSSVESIEIRRAARGETWVLRGGGRTLKLPPCVDFPLIAEHVLRRCPGATITTTMDRARSEFDQVFLPRPDRATAELSKPPDVAKEKMKARRGFAQYMLVLIGVTAVMGAGFFTWEYLDRDHAIAPYREQGLRVTGTVVRAGRQYELRYRAEAEDYAQWVGAIDDAPEWFYAGMQVEMICLPGQPAQAAAPWDLPRQFIPKWLLMVCWVLAVVCLAQAGWLQMVKVRARRAGGG